MWLPASQALTICIATDLSTNLVLWIKYCGFDAAIAILLAIELGLVTKVILTTYLINVTSNLNHKFDHFIKYANKDCFTFFVRLVGKRSILEIEDCKKDIVIAGKMILCQGKVRGHSCFPTSVQFFMHISLQLWYHPLGSDQWVESQRQSSDAGSNVMVQRQPNKASKMVRAILV